MQQLSGLDATFLYLETPQMPMHVGALHVFELPAGTKGKFVTALRKHIASRLPMTPVLRRRLWWMPLNMANPAWVDADPDLREHIVSVDLPKGSAMASLEAEVSRLHPVLLPRDRPLWKFFVFEGLAPSPGGQRRVALYTQLHHAAVDGQAAVALANAILDVSAEPRALAIRPSTRERVYKLEMTEMLRGVIGSQAQKVAAIVRNLPATAGTLKATALTLASRGIGDADAADEGNGKRSGKAGALASGKATGPSGNITLAPRTAFNASVTDGRAFAVVTLPLAEMKALGKAHGATLNDIVLMLCSTALRRYLARHHALPRKSLVAAVPITLRQAADVAAGAAAGNQASMSLVSLGTHIADTEARLAHVCQATKAMKSTMGGLKSILP
ncbi:MAG: wax ester/triacylglycerol synthase domain-containing protein, partial [Rubrivivax sp.]